MALRNVHMYEDEARDSYIGGLFVDGIVSKFNFYNMAGVLVRFDTVPVIKQANGDVLARDKTPLAPGDYYVVGPYQICTDSPLTRIATIDSSGRDASFLAEVQERDRHCLISGIKPIRSRAGEYIGMKASHIIPLRYQDEWLQNGFRNLLSSPPAVASDSGINDKQNGMLMTANCHLSFDEYYIAIDINDEYKIVPFDEAAADYTHCMPCLDAQFRNTPRSERPRDEYLYWHFRQAVLTNMKDAGEPVWENDFPPGTDMLGQIRAGPKPAQRMEYEIASRFAALGYW